MPSAELIYLFNKYILSRCSVPGTNACGGNAHDRQENSSPQDQGEVHEPTTQINGTELDPPGNHKYDSSRKKHHHKALTLAGSGKPFLRKAHCRGGPEEAQHELPRGKVSPEREQHTQSPECGQARGWEKGPDARRTGARRTAEGSGWRWEKIPGLGES